MRLDVRSGNNNDLSLISHVVESSEATEPVHYHCVYQLSPCDTDRFAVSPPGGRKLLRPRFYIHILTGRHK